MDDHIQNSSHSPEYEKRDVSVWIVTVTGIIVIIAIFVLMFAARDYFVTSRDKMIYKMVLSLETKTLNEVRDNETAILGSYGIIDKKNDVYRIPIDQAMDIMQEEYSRRGNQPE
jgi:hypothetical protein